MKVYPYRLRYTLYLKNGRIYRITVNNFRHGDRLIIYNYNYYGPGYWCGHVFINGKYIPFNRGSVKLTSVSVSGGKGYQKNWYIFSCYQDCRRGRAFLPIQEAKSLETPHFDLTIDHEFKIIDFSLKKRT